MFRNAIDALCRFVGWDNRPAPKRRRLEDDDTDMLNPKIRPVEDCNASGSRARMVQNNSFKVQDGPPLPSNSIKITDWEPNNKENFLKPLSYNYRPQIHNSSVHIEDKSTVLCCDEVQIVGRTVCNNSRLRDSVHASGRCVMGSEMGGNLPKCDIDGDIQIIHEQTKQRNYSSSGKHFKKATSPHYTGATHLFHRSSNKDGESSRGVVQSKALSPGRRKSTFVPQNSFESLQPEIQVLQASNRVLNSMDAPLRHQASIQSLDSVSSRNRSTLDHERRAEGYSKYYELMKRATSGINPQEMTSLSFVNGFRSFNDEAVLAYRGKESVKLKPQQMHHSMSFKSPSKQERLIVPVDKKHEVQPSTSAGRHQDNDIRILEERLLPKKRGPDRQLEVMTHLHKVIQEYQHKESHMRSLLNEKHIEAKRLAELNHKARLERQRKYDKEIAEKLQKYMVITGEDIEDEVQEISTLPELTEEMERKVDAALSSPENKLLVEAFSITIKGRDIYTLRPLAWLNDEIINFYMNLLIERGKNDNYPSVYAFNTFFYPKLVSNGFASLKRWTKKVDVFAHDFLVVPVHLGMHWCVAIIYLKEKQVRYFDSLGGTNQQCLNALLKYLQDEHMDKKQKQFDTSGWNKECAKDIPQQMNGSDCGMFSCMYAEYITRREPITFSQDDMPYFRRKMVYEILHKKLLC